LLDLFASILFAFAQWRITAKWLGLAARRLAGWKLASVRCAIFGFDALIAIAYALTFSELTGRLGVDSLATVIAGAIALAYLMIATTVYLARSGLRIAQERLSAGTDPSRRRLLKTAGAALTAAPFAAVGYGALIQRTDFRVREVDVALQNLPADLDGFRLLQLSDIHLSAFLSEAELARVIDASNELRAHIAVVTGDLISFRGDPLDACIRQLARIKSDAGVFACMGNHERSARAERYAAEAGARKGVLFLRGEARQLGFGAATLNLAGVDYQPLFRKKEYLRGAESLVRPGAVNVLLSHNSDVLPVAARQGYDLVLAGHTHGGQVTVEILDQGINPARFFTPYVHGLYRVGSTAEYVTRGIGTIAIPARIGAPPEISVLRLRKA
jgi:uncharacterized protein